MSGGDRPDDAPISGLHEQLRELEARLRERTRARWQRDLPFEELLFDRWTRAARLGFGPESSIYHGSYVFGDVEVGEHTWIGPMTLLDGGGGLRIGRYCSIAAGVQIYTHDTVRWALSGGVTQPERGPVSIGDCTYIGSQTVIGRGVTIGDHVVVAACSFVNRSLPSWSIAAGVPCRIIGRVVMDADQPRLEYDGTNPPEPA
jgi:acetyltransferase-like isoleucine patch superfamily enzyme